MASTKFNKHGVTDQQQRFVDEYIVNPSNATQAAVKAGYSPNSAKVTASRLLTYANVQRYANERRKALDEHKIASQKEVLQFWTSGMRGDRKESRAEVTPGGEVVEAEQSLSEKDKLKNAELLAKATGMFIDRQEVTNMQPIIIESAPVSDDEDIEVDDNDDIDDTNS